VILQDEDKEAGSSVSVTFQDNDIRDNNSVGLFIYTFGDGDITMSMEDCNVSGHDTGIHIEDFGGGSSASTYDISVSDSDISGNVSYGINNIVDSNIVNAEYNWWGDITGPYDGSDDRGTGGYYNPDGLGDQVSDYVDYIPWFLDPNMAGSSNVYILETGIYYPTIQAAIAAATSGQTVIIGSGTYVESGQIMIDKDLTVRGSNSTKPVVMPDQDTGDTGDDRAWWLVTAGTEFYMENLVLDGDVYKVYQAIRQKGSGSVTDVDFRNILYNESGPHYSGVAMAAFGDGPVHVDGCTFENIGRIGVLYFGTGITDAVFSNNTYTGKGPGDWLDYCIDLSAGATAEITNNTITDCNGIASSDGSTSAALMVTTYYGAGTQATITDNVLTNNTTGIEVGYDDTDTSVVYARRNKIYGNYTDGMSAKANSTVDAELNWWGDSSGPSGQGDGTGDVVTQYIDFTPWYCDEAMTQVCGLQNTYSRSPDVAVDSSGDYWLAYTVAKNTTVLDDYADLGEWHNSADSDWYEIYVKKASTIEDLLTATPVKVSEGQPETGHLMREVGIVELSGIMYIFVSTGRTSGYHVYYYWSSDTDGLNWNGPIEAADLGTSVLHVHATKANLGDGERAYISGAMSGNQINVWAFDGSSFSSPYTESGWGTGGPRLGQTVAIDNVLYTAAAHSSLKSIAVATTTDANSQTSYNDIATGLPDGQADITIDKVGDQYLLISAPWDSNDTQWLDLYDANSLSGPWTKTQVTDPNIGYWNYWPEIVVEDNNAYVFYTAEDTGSGQITMTPLADCPDGDLDGDCDVDFYDLAIFAAGWLDCGKIYEDCN